MKSDSIKVLVSTITALSGVGGSYWKMEDRVSKLEQQMAKQEQIKVTLPSDLHSQLVTKSIEVLGEVNLSQYLRMLIRRDLKQ